METSPATPRELYRAAKASPRRSPFGFGRRPALINVDLQKAYTCVREFPTAYATHPDQLDHVNELAALARGAGAPVIWTYVAYMANADDCGVWGTRTDTSDSVQNIKHGSRRAELDDRLDVDRDGDAILHKRMPSAFHETNLRSLLVWHRVDTVIVTGGSTSGCVRATVVDSLSHGYRTVVPEECVADKHEVPHFANLYDMHMKYADVLSVTGVADYLRGLKEAQQ